MIDEALNEQNLRETREITIEKSISDVIEEESLRYIGGYIVRKFVLKYSNLGFKAVESNDAGKSWIDKVNKSGLYAPSDTFMTQLKIMREMFVE